MKIMLIRTTGVHALTTLILHNYFDFQTQPDGQASLRDIQAPLEQLQNNFVFESKVNEDIFYIREVLTEIYVL